MAAELVYVPVGEDRLVAQVVAEACRAEGIHVELLTADNLGVDPIFGRIQGHRLLVAADDLERVKAILQRGRSEAS
ncbi:MAG: hypothetical protein V1757_03495 [Actinomycetota bacterium]